MSTPTDRLRDSRETADNRGVMKSPLLSPRWIAAHLIVLAVMVLFVNLGLWQLQRADERQQENQLGTARLAAQPFEVSTAVQAAGQDLESLEYRPVTATGAFDPDHEVLVRSQVYEGQAGFHVVTPLVLDDGGAVMVNRGWVPLTLDTVPVAAAPPPDGTVEIEGLVRLGQVRGAVGPQDPAGATTVSRIDIGHLDEIVPQDLLPVWLQMVEPPSEIPVTLELPTFDDPGPHVEYALQWFAFALIVAVGYGFLLRRVLKKSGGNR